jgi:hypothetical protein
MHRAPFGSLITTAPFEQQHAARIIKSAITWAAKNKITNLIVRSYPEAYNPECFGLIRKTLLSLDFEVEYEDVSQIVAVTENPMNVDTHKRRRLRHASATGFQFAILSPEHLADAYTLIVDSRQNKGYPVTMTLHELQNTFSKFVNSYLLFGVKENDKLIGTAVCIRVSSEILYAFYIGDSLDHRPLSPVTFLVDGIYNYCRTHGYKLLDLGISSDKGILNSGLYNFKRTFGAIDSPKPTFIKRL